MSWEMVGRNVENFNTYAKPSPWSLNPETSNHIKTWEPLITTSLIVFATVS